LKRFENSNFTNTSSNKIKYKLFAIIYKREYLFGGGHYICFIRKYKLNNNTTNIDNNWVFFDDTLDEHIKEFKSNGENLQNDFVEKMSSNNVDPPISYNGNEYNPQMFFYEKIDQSVQNETKQKWNHKLDTDVYYNWA